MIKAKRKLKKAAGKSAKRPKPRNAKFITRAEARRRAERHVLNRIFKGATVRDGAEAKLCLYNRGDWSANDVWVVYKNPKEIAFKSADVILVCKRTGRVLYEGSAGDEGEVMKFTVERIALQRMVEQLKIERGVKGQSQRMMRLSACVARVFVEANGVAAGIEALVQQDGACNVPRMKFLKVLRTFHPKQNITLAADAGGLRIEGFVMRVTCFSLVGVAPGEFQVFPVTDAWLAPPETTKPTPPPESRWLKSRWWE